MSPYILLSVIHFHHILPTYSIEQHTFTESWPRFYQSGESTRPTTSILNNLTYYHERWQTLQSYDFGQTYTFTMAWDCGGQCTECLRANKFIQVEENEIISLEISALNDDSKLMACDNVNETTQISEYKSIDELYEMVINWVQSALSSSDISVYTIHELLLHKEYYFPIAVKLSDREYIAWNIVCFQPGLVSLEDDVCDFTSNGEKVYGHLLCMYTNNFKQQHKPQTA